MALTYEENLELILEDRGRSPKGLNKEQKKQLTEYVAYMQGQGLGIRSILEKTKFLALWMGWSKSDLQKPGFDTVNEYLQHRAGKVSLNSLITNKNIIHSYLNWVYDGEIPKNINKLFKMAGQKVKQIRKRVAITASEVLDEEEILKLIRQAPTHLEKGLIAFIYGSAGRISAVLSMKMDNIKVEGNDIFYCFPETDGANKSGEGGQDWLKYSWKIGVQWVKDWLINRPENGEGWLWVNKQGRKENDHWFREVLHRVRERAGIDKPVRPHLLRHSRITQLRRQGIADIHIKRIAGWDQFGHTIEKYSHLDATDTNEAIDAMNDDLPKRTTRVAEKVECPLCHRIAPPGQPFCANCGTNLDREQSTMEKLQEQMREEIRAEILTEMEKEREDMRKEMEKMFSLFAQSMERKAPGEILEEIDKSEGETHIFK